MIRVISAVSTSSISTVLSLVRLGFTHIAASLDSCPTAKVFLKDTLEAAQSDAEQLVVERMHKRAAYIEQLEGVFRAIDVTGTGMIGEERLSEILVNPRVKAYFQTIDLDLHEGTALFHLLANGEGEARWEQNQFVVLP